MIGHLHKLEICGFNPEIRVRAAQKVPKTLKKTSIDLIRPTKYSLLFMGNKYFFSIKKKNFNLRRILSFLFKLISATYKNFGNRKCFSVADLNQGRFEHYLSVC